MTTGSYILFILLNNLKSSYSKINIGSLGEIVFKNGIYCYIGSAMGKNSTNIKNRVSRHLRSSYYNLINEDIKIPKKHWHIDYLLSSKTAKIIKIWIYSSKNKEECQIVEIFMSQKYDYILNFGCSDCKCKSHLFFLNDKNQNQLI